MKSAFLRVGYLLLALSLVTAGMPLHALANGLDAGAESSLIESSLIEGESFQESSEATGKGGCPHHSARDAAPDALQSELTTPPLAEECCGPDCRCSCAGLTLIPTPHFDAPAAPAPESGHPGNQLYLPSLTSTPLPRPPQA